MTVIFNFIGWCYEDNHDKIWGYFHRLTDISTKPNKNLCIFWGRRGNALQIKSSTDYYKLHKTVRSKVDKGYQHISESKLLEVWPSFYKDLEEKLLVELLAGNVKYHTN